MRQRLHAIRQNDGGFTLIELLVAVTILGVLSGIVVFAVANFQNDGVLSACKADKKNVEIAAEAYRAKDAASAYPAAISDLVTAGYLKSAPSSTKYTISLNSSTGAVTSTLAGC